MTDALTYLGVDGCRAGWLAAEPERDPRNITREIVYPRPE